MKGQLSLLSLLCLLGLLQAAPSAVVEQAPALLPKPQEMKLHLGKPGFQMTQGIRVAAAQEKCPVAGSFIKALQVAGVPVVLGQEASELNIRHARTGQKGWYALGVTDEAVNVVLSDEESMHLAAQTLAQAIVKDKDGRAALPGMDIEDYPLLSYRGLHIDPCRHFVPVHEMKRIIALMARYKFNRLHWHLTEDQGWRIEIKKYPKLTTVGARRESSLVVRDPSQQDGQPYEYAYTQDDIREVVQFAHERGIIIIPEIEVPGHAAAAIAAYPELGCDDIEGFAPAVECRNGVFPYVFSPKETTFSFLADVFDEVCALFPRAPYIHVGGDEAPRDQWKASPYVQNFMKEHGMQNEHEVQVYFMQRCEEMLKARGRRMVGWDEIQEGGVSKTAIIMLWQSLGHAKLALAQGNEIIMTPMEFCYFDFHQSTTTPADRFYYGLHTPVDKDWRNIYTRDIYIPGMSEEQKKQIIGLQANNWSELIPNSTKWDYNVFPRALALAEVAWLPLEKRGDIEEFFSRMQGQYPYLDSMRVNFRHEAGQPRLAALGEDLTDPKPHTFRPSALALAGCSAWGGAPSLLFPLPPFAVFAACF